MSVLMPAPCWWEEQVKMFTIGVQSIFPEFALDNMQFHGSGYSYGQESILFEGSALLSWSLGDNDATDLYFCPTE